MQEKLAEPSPCLITILLYNADVEVLYTPGCSYYRTGVDINQRGVINTSILVYSEHSRFMIEISSHLYI